MAHKIVNGQQVELTAEEISAIQAQEATWNAGAYDRAMNDLRQKRDALLKASDWEVIKAKETGSTLSAGFKAYRQALRDITEGLTTVEEVNAVEFPVKP